MFKILFIHLKNSDKLFIFYSKNFKVKLLIFVVHNFNFFQTEHTLLRKKIAINRVLLYAINKLNLFVRI